ncbi:MAG: hypothetical protein H0T52_04265 [Lautropia sp.]|nr:hypothetical protein [Lautropia sp.]
MSIPGKAAGSILLGLLANSAPDTAHAAGLQSPEPVAREVVDVLLWTSAPEAAGFPWGIPASALAASGRFRASAGFSAKCVADIQAPGTTDCTAFVPTSGDGFARAYYATDRDGLLMVESNATPFDCARFEEIASPAGAHRAELARLGWRYLRRERRPEGDDTLVESQLYARNGIGVELAFIKVESRNVCGVQSFVSKGL